MTGRRSGPALLLIAALSGCGGARSEPPASRPAASFELREGSRLFAAYCAACHGESGRGDGVYLSAGASAAPPDFDAPGARERLRRDLLTARLGSAKPLSATHCPPWGATFSAEEIEALATFVEALAPGTDAPREQR
jgi:mono/diheme cytochrome c family protein